MLWWSFFDGNIDPSQMYPKKLNQTVFVHLSFILGFSSEICYNCKDIENSLSHDPIKEN